MISMIVVNYNSGSLLAECVQAALPQVSEILVVDNAQAIRVSRSVRGSLPMNLDSGYFTTKPISASLLPAISAFPRLRATSCCF